jgi:hypothetical protein
VIALIVTPDGFPLAYEVLPGNTADCTTLRSALQKIEAQYGKAKRIWIMDRGIPTDEVLAEMRKADPPVSYLVGSSRWPRASPPGPCSTSSPPSRCSTSTTDGRKLILSRYTELNADQKLLVKRLKLDLPSQPPPRITAPVGQSARLWNQQV